MIKLQNSIQVKQESNKNYEITTYMIKKGGLVVDSTSSATPSNPLASAETGGETTHIYQELILI